MNNQNINTASPLIYKPPFAKAELQKAFSGSTIDFEDAELFDQTSVVKMGSWRGLNTFPHLNSENIDYEIRLYVQHLVCDLKRTALTVSHHLFKLRTIAAVINEHFPNANSISDIRKERLLFLAREKMAAAGFPCEATIQMSSRIKQSTGKRAQEVRRNELDIVVDALWMFRKRAGTTDVPEYEKDYWDIRNLGVSVDVPKYNPRYHLNFEGIPDAMKPTVKEYIFHRVQCKAFSTVYHDLMAIKNFSGFLTDHYQGIHSLSAVDRDVIKAFIQHMIKKGLGASWVNGQLCGLRTFFQDGAFLGLSLPDASIIRDSDFQKKILREPDYFSDHELQQINEKLDTLPKQIARMTIVLEETGIRLADLCSATISVSGRSCLIEAEDDSFLWTYYMPKVKRNNTIPVSALAGLALKEAIRESIDAIGPNAKFIFSKSKTLPISTANYVDTMHRYVANNGMTSDDGSRLQFRGHTFRGTVATDLANRGITPKLITRLLGQKTLGVLQHYVKIHGTTMNSYLKPLLDEMDALILGSSKNIHVQIPSAPNLNEVHIVLPNGVCTKNVEAGVCGEITQCLQCVMFRPQKSDLHLFESQLIAAEKNIELANSQGFTRLADVNTELAERLRKIVDKIRKE